MEQIEHAKQVVTEYIEDGVKHQVEVDDVFSALEGKHLKEWPHVAYIMITDGLVKAPKENVAETFANGAEGDDPYLYVVVIGPTPYFWRQYFVDEFVREG